MTHPDYGFKLTYRPDIVSSLTGSQRCIRDIAAGTVFMGRAAAGFAIFSVLFHKPKR
jgi:hypothetical protein